MNEAILTTSDARTSILKTAMTRPYEKGDEDCVVALWLKAYCSSEYGRERGADKRGSKERNDFWAEQRRTVMALLEACETTLVVDKEERDAIWAFVCQSPGVLHFAVTKADFPLQRRRIMLACLVDFMAPRTVMTHEIPELRVLFGGPPHGWFVDSRLITPAIKGHFG
jgi:hypothetical protein